MGLRWFGIGVLLAVVVGGAGCDDSSTQSGGATPAPTPAPSPAPTGGGGGGASGGGATADGGSPAKAAALAFARAVAAGDLEAAKAPATGDATAMASLETMVKFAASDAKWQAALQAKFGQAAPNAFSATFVAGVENASEEVSGDAAILTTPGARTGTQMLRQGDGTWKVNMGYDPTGRAASAVETLRALARVNEEMAEEVTAGKHASLGEALQAHAQKRIGALSNAPPAAAPAQSPASPGDAGTAGDGLD